MEYAAPKSPLRADVKWGDSELTVLSCGKRPWLVLRLEADVELSVGISVEKPEEHLVLVVP